jgi:hypothetical protein
MKFSSFIAVLITSLSFNVAAHDLSIDQLVFSKAWVKAPMPGMQMTAGFVEIENKSDEDARLVAVKTNISKISELHTMMMVDNVMQMRQVKDGWVIPAGETLRLAPGGNHAMLMGVSGDLKGQTEVILEYEIEGLGWISVPSKLHMAH